MASNQTANYGLNQWAGSDRFLREEFNADNAKVDEALYEMSVRRTTLLKTVTADAAAQQLDVDLSGIDLTQYSQLRLVCQMTASDTGTAGAPTVFPLTMRFNGLTGTYYCQLPSGSAVGGDVTSTQQVSGIDIGYLAPSGSYGALCVTLTDGGKSVMAAGTGYACGSDRYFHFSSTLGGTISAVKFTGLTAINLCLGVSTYRITAGAKVYVYGTAI